MADLIAFNGGGSSQQVAGELAEEIKAVVRSYNDRMALATAIGVLQLVQIEILAENA